VVERLCSDIFLFLLIFLLDKKPFSGLTLRLFSGLNFGGQRFFTPEPMKTKNIVSPNLLSKLSPSLSLGKSPYIRQRFGLKGMKVQNEQSKNILLKYIHKPGEGGPGTSIFDSPVKQATIKKNSMTALKFVKLIEDGMSPKKTKAKSKEISPGSVKLKSLSNEDQE
jgi:hypothetical protein